MNTTHRVLKITIGAMHAVALFWVAFGVCWLFRDSPYNVFYFVSAVGNAVLLALSALLMHKRKIIGYWLGIFVVVANIVLTVTDEFGWFDLMYLIPTCFLFVMMIMSRPVLTQTTNGK